MVAETPFSSLWLLVGALVALCAVIWAVVDIAKSPWLKTADRVVWIIIVVVLPLIGAASWMLMRGGLAKREE